jgi:hypothetical protein
MFRIHILLTGTFSKVGCADADKKGFLFGPAKRSKIELAVLQIRE